MQVNLEKLKEQLEREIQALEQKKVVLADQVNHVEAVCRLAGRLGYEVVGEGEIHQPSNEGAETDAEAESKVNGKAQKAPGRENFEWAFQGNKAASEA